MPAPDSPPVPEIPQPITVTSLALAPAAAGCALGILIGRRLKRRGSEAAALAFLAVAAAAALPLAAEAAVRLVNRPQSRRRVQGIQRRIRDAADVAFADELAGTEEPSAARNTVSFPGL
jgi:hypothetical protein